MSDFLKLQGKTIYLAGASNKKSIASFVGKTLIELGAKCIFSVQTPAQLESVQKLFPESRVFVHDVYRDKNLSEKINENLDGFVHSLAYANFSEGPKGFLETKREDYLEASGISSFSLVEMCGELQELFHDEASVVTISISSTKATSYGYLGPIKAMLEASVPYLAKAFSSKKNIRVNAVAAGPLKTSASAGIPGYVDNYLFSEALTLRKRSLETQEVADSVCYLLSPRSSGINATTIKVDAGMDCNYFDQEIVKAFSNRNM